MSAGTLPAPGAPAGRLRLPSRFELLHRLATASVAGLGFAALAVGRQLPTPAAVAAGLALLLFLWDERPRLSARAWFVVQLGFIFWLGSQWLGGHRYFLALFAQLLVFVQLHRLLSRRGARDDLYLFFIAFGQLLLASVLTISASFFVVFLLFLLALTWALLLTRLALTLEEDWAEQGGTGPVPTRLWRSLDPLLRWPLFTAVGVLAVLLLVATVALFFVLPRMQASFLSGALMPPVHVSGFSDQVRLGDVGLLQLSDEPVMRVKVTDRRGDPVEASALYWHGLALDRFDGAAWSLSDARRTRLERVSPKTNRGPPRSRSWTLRQEVNLEALDSQVLFHVGEAAGVYGDWPALETVETEGYYMLGGRSRQSYVVYSEPRPRDPDALRREDLGRTPPALLETYTQLPTTLSPRLRAVATEWTQGAASPVDAALLIQNKLRTDFTYSLDQAASGYDDPLVAFIDEVQEGHCEYFATAMAVLLRTRGLPVRVVNGFSGGDWNPVGDYWLIRQRHAHSWVEMYFPDAGWVVFDPTPSASGGLDAAARLTLSGRLRAWSDYGSVLWSDVMLDYGPESWGSGLSSSLAAVASLGGVDLGLPGTSGGGRAGGAAGGLGSVLGSALIGLALAFLVALGAVVGLRQWLRRRRSGLAPELYAAERVLARLRQRWSTGVGRAAEGSPARRSAPGEAGPTLQWARWAASADPGSFGEAPALVEAYYAARFGQHALPATVLTGLRDANRRARSWRPSGDD